MARPPSMFYWLMKNNPPHSSSEGGYTAMWLKGHAENPVSIDAAELMVISIYCVWFSITDKFSQATSMCKIPFMNVL